MFLKRYGCILALVLLQGLLSRAMSQTVPGKHCATMDALKTALENDPALRMQYENDVQRIQQLAAARAASPNARVAAAPVYIPVVFHIVMADPTEVTDKMIDDQLRILNEDYAGLNADSTKIPGWFKPLFGKSSIQFVLAKRTPSNGPTTGINRVVTTQTNFTQANNYVKHASTGGADSWAPTRYLNIWVCKLPGTLLGYSTFPTMTPASEQGVVITNVTMPGGSMTGYNDGRTLTHEVGHYFFLYHIWGDDDGACDGSDGVGDTPNQSDATAGCFSGVKTDACSPVAPGIMYQNYMDYSSNGCMSMFTLGQVTRMEAALNAYRLGLTTSNAAVSPLQTVDAQVLSIDFPYKWVCDTRFEPVITLRNYGSLPLTSVTISASVDGGTPVVTRWTGNLASLATASVTLNGITFTGNGDHQLKVQVSLPNGVTDLGPNNDALTKSFVYPSPKAPPITEGFESGSFPANGWDVVNADNSYTWEQTTTAAKTGSSSVMVRNWSYNRPGAVDQLRLPLVSITEADSAYLSFQVAAAIQTNASTRFNNWDTLQVLVSTDCGNTFTSLYKKWGGTLATRTGSTTNEFIPNASEWRKDSVNLWAYINKGPLLIAFAHSNGNENNVYLDDINLYKTGNSVDTKGQHWIVTPSPAEGPIKVTFGAPPARLQSISIFNGIGQKVAEQKISGTASTTYDFNVARFAAGIYSVRVVHDGRTETKKFMRK